jgi:hypothetical protein
MCPMTFLGISGLNGQSSLRNSQLVRQRGTNGRGIFRSRPYYKTIYFKGLMETSKELHPGQKLTSLSFEPVTSGIRNNGA